MFKKILLATDGSEHSLRAAKYAVEIGEKFNSAIEVVYVVSIETSKSDVLGAASDFEIEKKRRDKLKSVKELIKESGLDYKTHILHGEPGPVIVDYANKNKFDCVVLGSRGLNKLQTFILGSVSHKIAKRAECPVLIVK
ncbi:universal stress protein [Oceanobacillus bengalensis]|uniref:Universal stress protein n=1 Tax=Oceanobacillus bengalensis TaxID=1435466 RepID=A0A494Z8J3_9BACI|nr:universal stress protein [Oceanobacillus bengalensis]RKQ18658.1 universal stress protein [Oceanobacillus bengalensis]